MRRFTTGIGAGMAIQSHTASGVVLAVAVGAAPWVLAACAHVPNYLHHLLWHEAEDWRQQ